MPIERRAGTHALVPREVMRNESFTASCVAILFMSATFFAALLYLPQFMEKQLGYSPLEAGVGMLPFLATFALVSFVAGPLYNRARGEDAGGARRRLHHPRAVPLLAASTPAPATARWSSGMVVLGIGIGSFYPTATTAGVTSVDESQTSLAGGIVYMFQIAGGSIGLGLTTTVFSAAIPPFVDGIQAAFRLDAALSLVGLLIAIAFVGGRLFGGRDRRTKPLSPALLNQWFWPGPPIRMSSPGPPRSWSLPCPPTSPSSPGPPRSQSSPRRPISVVVRGRR